MGLSDFKDTRRGSVCILGNGPSLDTFDIDRLKYPTIGVNRSWRKVVSYWHVISAASVYFQEIGTRRWKPKFIFVPGPLVVSRNKLNRYVHSMDFSFLVEVPDNFPSAPAAAFKLTGLLAIWLAAYIGFEDVCLLGYDGKDEYDRYRHFKTEIAETTTLPGFCTQCQLRHPIGGEHEQHHKELARLLPPAVRVFNCNPDSNVTTWPYKEVPYR